MLPAVAEVIRIPQPTALLRYLRQPHPRLIGDLIQPPVRIGHPITSASGLELVQM
jgi:hypothetical protein